jgi:hypothetical protein
MVPQPLLLDVQFTRNIFQWPILGTLHWDKGVRWVASMCWV